jgi:hypothetical protein
LVTGLYTYFTQFSMEEIMNKAAKSYTLELSLSMLAYVVVLFVSIWLLNQMPESPWRFVLALLPVLPLLFALAAFLRFLGRMDELQQRIQLNAIGFAAGATGLVALTVGFLGNAGLPQPSWIWIFPMMIMLWGIGGAIANWRYK